MSNPTWYLRSSWRAEWLWLHESSTYRHKHRGMELAIVPDPRGGNTRGASVTTVSREVVPLEHLDDFAHATASRRILVLEDLGPAFAGYIDGVLGRQSDYARRLIRLLRWRHHRGGPPRPLSSARLSYSLDRRGWHQIMPMVIASVSVEMALKLNNRQWRELASRTERGDDEPFAHELLREALDLRHRHRRSALIMAVAAAEVALKEAFGRWKPDARWVFENMPSPPQFRILLGLATAIGDPARTQIDEMELPKRLQQAAELRNRIVHAASTDVSDVEIQRAIDTCEMVVRMSDFLSGESWASPYVEVDMTEDETERDIRLDDVTLKPDS